MPVSVHPTSPTILARLFRLNIERFIRLQPLHEPGIYQPVGGLYNMRIPRTEALLQDTMEFFVHSNDSVDNDQDICRRSYPMR